MSRGASRLFFEGSSHPIEVVAHVQRGHAPVCNDTFAKNTKEIRQLISTSKLAMHLHSHVADTMLEELPRRMEKDTELATLAIHLQEMHMTINLRAANSPF